MSCYCPTYVQRNVDTITGIVTTKYIGKHNELSEKNFLHRDFSGQKDSSAADFFDGRISSTVIQIPCGKCIGCRIDYSRSWADRMTYHSLDKKILPNSSWFITLTYDDEHLSDLEHSENYDLYALNYDHSREFVKRLRNKFRDCQIDFYLSGEYGDSSFRPHFHLICYNVPLDDLEYWKSNEFGDPYYTSDTIEKIWSKGFCTISPFTWLGAAYTASYVQKKRDGRMLCEYTAVGLTPERCFSSRRPGIAHDFYLEHYFDLWKNDGMKVSRSVNSTGHLGIPRYFRKLAEKYGHFDELYDYELRCAQRSNVLNPLQVDNSSFDLDSVSTLLKFQEKEILSRTHNKKI